jgi:metal-sulfur cluster biosynthetic enzyme
MSAGAGAPAQTGALHAAIERAIGAVDDPCSIAARAPMSVRDMGLVRGWYVDTDGTVVITISPTAPSCILMSSIATGIEERVRQIPDVGTVRVEVDTVTVWSPDLMSHQGRKALDERRSASLLSVPVRPREWENDGHRPREGSATEPGA